MWLLFLDREWMFGRLRLYSAPVILLILAAVLVVSWLFGVILTRVLNLPNAEAFSLLGVGLVVTASTAAAVTLTRMIWRRTTRRNPSFGHWPEMDESTDLGTRVITSPMTACI